MSIASRARHPKQPTTNSRTRGPRLYSVATPIKWNSHLQRTEFFHCPTGAYHRTVAGNVVHDQGKYPSQRDNHRAISTANRNQINRLRFHGAKHAEARPF